MISNPRPDDRRITSRQMNGLGFRSARLALANCRFSLVAYSAARDEAKAFRQGVAREQHGGQIYNYGTNAVKAVS